MHQNQRLPFLAVRGAKHRRYPGRGRSLDLFGCTADKLRHRFAVDSEGEDTVPAIGQRIYAPRPQSFLPAMQDVVLSAAEATGREIDLAVRDLVEAGAVCARAILEKRRDDLDAGVPLPIARETLTAEEFAPLRPVAVQEIEKATE